MAKSTSSHSSPVPPGKPSKKKGTGTAPVKKKVAPVDPSHESEFSAGTLPELPGREETAVVVSDMLFDKFLEALSELPARGAALQKAGLTRMQVAERLKNDKEFAAKYVEAWELGVDAMEDEAVRRAVLGWQEPVFTRDGYAGEVTKYSDTLLIHLLKGNRRKYRGDDLNQNRGLSEESKKHLKSVLDRVVEDHLS